MMKKIFIARKRNVPKSYHKIEKSHEQINCLAVEQVADYMLYSFIQNPISQIKII